MGSLEIIGLKLVFIFSFDGCVSFFVFVGSKGFFFVEGVVMEADIDDIDGAVGEYIVVVFSIQAVFGYSDGLFGGDGVHVL